MSPAAFDFKKEYKDLYMPKAQPVLVEVPAMKFLMLDGSGDPNNNVAFQQATELLYGLSYTLKMSKKKGSQPPGYFEYVVPPLEGLWWIEGGQFSLDIRDNWLWTLMIRQPEFVDAEFCQWAAGELSRKKPELSHDKVRLETFSEGLCVQIMHVGPYATEPESMSKIEKFITGRGLRDLVGQGGKHHEIYLSDPRKAKPESMKTVLRHPVAE
ncbi:MAG: GyrI-like domain-containing protein [Syntrophomonadaceae bacterium]|nr:GyrI-like domain-containing protein [Syntrophomonadaceae bacterium]